MNELEAATTQELVRELDRRSEFMIMAYSLAEEDKIHFAGKGSLTNRIGAAHRLLRDLNTEHDAEEKTPEPTEEEEDDL